MITQSRLKQLVLYDKSTGIFTCAVPRGNMNAGDRCGNRNKKDGYIRLIVDGSSYLAHRLAWLYEFGKWPDGVIDHIDHNTSNNKIDNLRDVSRSENLHNQIKKQRGNVIVTSIGVHFNNKYKKFVARIKVSGKQIHLGNFDDEESASIAYLNAKKKYHPSAPEICFKKGKA